MHFFLKSCNKHPSKLSKLKQYLLIKSMQNVCFRYKVKTWTINLLTKVHIQINLIIGITYNGLPVTYTICLLHQWQCNTHTHNNTYTGIIIKVLCSKYRLPLVSIHKPHGSCKWQLLIKLRNFPSWSRMWILLLLKVWCLDHTLAVCWYADWIKCLFATGMTRIGKPTFSGLIDNYYCFVFRMWHTDI